MASPSLASFPQASALINSAASIFPEVAQNPTSALSSIIGRFAPSATNGQSSTATPAATPAPEQAPQQQAPQQQASGPAQIPPSNPVKEVSPPQNGAQPVPPPPQVLPTIPSTPNQGNNRNNPVNLNPVPNGGISDANGNNNNSNDNSNSSSLDDSNESNTSAILLIVIPILLVAAVLTLCFFCVLKRGKKKTIKNSVGSTALNTAAAKNSLDSKRKSMLSGNQGTTGSQNRLGNITAATAAASDSAQDENSMRAALDTQTANNSNTTTWNSLIGSSSYDASKAVKGAAAAVAAAATVKSLSSNSSPSFSPVAAINTKQGVRFDDSVQKSPDQLSAGMAEGIRSAGGSAASAFTDRFNSAISSSSRLPNAVAEASLMPGDLSLGSNETMSLDAGLEAARSRSQSLGEIAIPAGGGLSESVANAIDSTRNAANESADAAITEKKSNIKKALAFVMGNSAASEAAQVVQPSSIKLPSDTSSEKLSIRTLSATSDNNVDGDGDNDKDGAAAQMSTPATARSSSLPVIFDDSVLLEGSMIKIPKEAYQIPALSTSPKQKISLGMTPLQQRDDEQSVCPTDSISNVGAAPKQSTSVFSSKKSPKL